MLFFDRDNFVSLFCFLYSVNSICEINAIRWNMSASRVFMVNKILMK